VKRKQLAFDGFALPIQITYPGSRHDRASRTGRRWDVQCGSSTCYASVSILRPRGASITSLDAYRLQLQGEQGNLGPKDLRGTGGLVLGGDVLLLGAGPVKGPAMRQILARALSQAGWLVFVDGRQYRLPPHAAVCVIPVSTTEKDAQDCTPERLNIPTVEESR